MEKPKVIVLSGSTRFYDVFVEQYIRVSSEGNIPISIAANLKNRPDYEKIKPFLDKMYLDAIRFLADELFVLNVGGYIGDSCKQEIYEAELKGIPIKYLEGNKNK